jgi:hypothetical protein
MLYSPTAFLILTFDLFNCRETLGVSSAWMNQHIYICPPGAAQDVVERFARVWLWHFVSSFLFPDTSGNTECWAVLPILIQPWENIALYS